MVWRAGRSVRSAPRPARMVVGAFLVGVAAFLLIRAYPSTVPDELRPVLGEPVVHCEAPIFDLLDDGPPGGSLSTPARRAALGVACDESSTRAFGAVVCFVAGGALLWTAREDLAEELF